MQGNRKAHEKTLERTPQAYVFSFCIILKGGRIKGAVTVAAKALIVYSTQNEGETEGIW